MHNPGIPTEVLISVGLVWDWVAFLNTPSDLGQVVHDPYFEKQWYMFLTMGGKKQRFSKI